MTNSIDAHVEFSFKGETYSLAATIELDDFPGAGASHPSLHSILARKHGIDTYSYLYEIMEEEEIRFDNPQGWAVDFFTEGKFDLPAYIAARQELKTLDLLQAIATRELGIDNLAQHPELKNALLQAYELGRTHHAL